MGLANGLALALTGHQVRFLDTDPARIALLARGASPLPEPGFADALALCAGRTVFGTDYAEALAGSEAVLVAVGTPAAPDGRLDLSRLEPAVAEIARSAPGPRMLVVIKATVPPGTTREVGRKLERLRPSVRWRVVFNPEFLREGRALWDALHPSRFVVGYTEPDAAEEVQRLYRPILEARPGAPVPEPAPPPGSAAGRPAPAPVPVVLTTPESAELGKLAANAFLAARVSLINEVADLCDVARADVADVAKIVGLDPRLGPDFLEAGLGYGGGCLPKDVVALGRLSRSAGLDPVLLDAVAQVNERRKDTAVRLLRELTGGLEAARVAILGLAYKPGTADLRGSPGVELAARLASEGALVRAHDPAAAREAAGSLPPAVRTVSSPSEALEGADAAVLTTAWPEYVALDWTRLRRRMRRPIVLDGRNALDRDVLVAAGFVYLAFGRGRLTTSGR